MPAISSGWAWRPSAIMPCMLLARGPSAGFMSGLTGPGCTLVTGMPRGPRPRARPLVRPTMAALLARGRVDGLREGGGVCTVGTQRKRFAPACFDGCHQRLRRGFGATVGEGHGRSVARQALDDGGADATRAAGDKGHLARQQA